jgi:hypothetical protein
VRQFAHAKYRGGAVGRGCGRGGRIGTAQPANWRARGDLPKTHAGRFSFKWRNETRKPTSRTVKQTESSERRSRKIATNFCDERSEKLMAMQPLLKKPLHAKSVAGRLLL